VRDGLADHEWLWRSGEILCWAGVEVKEGCLWKVMLGRGIIHHRGTERIGWYVDTIASESLCNDWFLTRKHAKWGDRCAL